MSEPLDPGPLDLEVAALLDDVRSCDETDPAFDSASAERVLGRVERAVHEAPASGWSRVRLRSGVLLASVCLLATFAGTKLIGAGGEVVPATAPSTALPSATAVDPPVGATSARGDDVPTMHVDDLPSSASVPVPPPPSQLRRAEPPSTSTARGSDLAEEYRLVEGARASLAAKDYAAAFRSLREHEERFSSGQLGQENESLYIQALVESGRLAEARERAQRFRARFPSGLLLPSVMQAIASSAPDSSTP